MLRWCRGAEEVVRCRGAERWLLVQGAGVQRRCRGGAEVVQRWCRGAGEVVRCRGAEWWLLVQRCRVGAEVVESPGTQVVSAEVVRGAEERGSGGAEVQKW